MTPSVQCAIVVMIQGTMNTENQNRSQEPSQTRNLVGVDVPRLIRLLRDSYPSDEQGKIEDEISDALEKASNETLAELLRDPIVCTRRLYDGVMREAVARLLLLNAKGDSRSEAEL